MPEVILPGHSEDLALGELSDLHTPRPPPEPPPLTRQSLPMQDIPFSEEYKSTDDSHSCPISTSSSSELEDIGRDNDMEAPSCWTTRSIHSNTSEVCHVDVPDSDIHVFPPGSLFDHLRTDSPTGVDDFLFLHMEQHPPKPIPQVKDVFDEFVNDTVVPICCTIRTIGVQQDTARLCKIVPGSLSHNGVMADTGTNVCMGPSADPLINVKSIDPVPVGLAIKSTDPASILYCHQMGYLPMPKADGSTHLEPVLVNPDASNFIMLSEAILHSSPHFTSFKQTGFKQKQEGLLEFFDDNDALQISLRLDKRNGFY